MIGGDDITKISLKDYFSELLNELKKVYDQNNLVSNQFDIDPINFSMEKIAPLAFLVHEIVSNSYKYAFSENIHNPIISFSFKKLANRTLSFSQGLRVLG